LIELGFSVPEKSDLAPVAITGGLDKLFISSETITREDIAEPELGRWFKRSTDREIQTITRRISKLPDGKPLSILSVGEGTSGLTAYWRSLGHRAYGLDLWYDENLNSPAFAKAERLEEMKAYVAENREFLISGDATDLTRARLNGKPYQIEAQDIVVTHFMFEDLTPSGKLRLIQEGLRVLKPGGQLRIATHLVDVTRLYELANQAVPKPDRPALHLPHPLEVAGLLKLAFQARDSQPANTVKFHLLWGKTAYTRELNADEKAKRYCSQWDNQIALLVFEKAAR